MIGLVHRPFKMAAMSLISGFRVKSIDAATDSVTILSFCLFKVATSRPEVN